MEFLIIKTQREHFMNEIQELAFVKLVNKHLGNYLIKAEDTWFDLSKSTYEELMEQSKRIFLLSTTIENEEAGFYLMKKYYHTYWVNTNKPEKLINQLQKDLDQKP